MHREDNGDLFQQGDNSPAKRHLPDSKSASQEQEFIPLNVCTKADIVKLPVLYGQYNSSENYQSLLRAWD